VTGNNTDSGYGVYAVGLTGVGATGTDAGIFGTSYSGSGVIGTSGTSSGVSGGSDSGDGVDGVSTTGIGVNGAGHIGVSGTGRDTGVYGNSTLGNGVYGTNHISTLAAVQGVNTGGGSGVVGFGSGASSTGVGGGTDIGTGFYGAASSTGTGVVATSVSGTAFYAVAQAAGQFAGVLAGKVQVQGDFSVTGAKAAAVRGADGALHQLYSLECPESWFEDFGSAQLSNGSVLVALEPGFAGVVKTDQYRVFPVPKGDCKGLYIGSQTSSGFTVHELQGGTSNIAFDYRVVAKRKDIAGTRLEHVDEPPAVQLLKLPEVPATPSVPAAPPAPTPPRHSG
jgi:hypothetical protein